MPSAPRFGPWTSAASSARDVRWPAASTISSARSDQPGCRVRSRVRRLMRSGWRWARLPLPRSRCRPRRRRSRPRTSCSAGDCPTPFGGPTSRSRTGLRTGHRPALAVGCHGGLSRLPRRIAKAAPIHLAASRGAGSAWTRTSLAGERARHAGMAARRSPSGSRVDPRPTTVHGELDDGRTVGHECLPDGRLDAGVGIHPDAAGAEGTGGGGEVDRAQVRRRR